MDLSDQNTFKNIIMEHEKEIDKVKKELK